MMLVVATLSHQVLGAIHTVRPGESLSSIAAMHGTTVNDLLIMNDIPNPNRIQVGDQIVVADQPVKYVVQRGDSLTLIAARFGVRVSDLVNANNIRNANLLYPGQELIVSRGLREHRVTRGETLSGIAQRYGVTTASLQLINDLPNAHRIVVGQSLFIPPLGGGFVDATPARLPRVARFFDRWPAEGVISSNYGMRSGRMHHGTDVAAPHGANIYAVAPGTVTYAGNAGTYGLLVTIDHGGGIETRYAHASRIHVAVGEQVYGGQVIAAVGSTGRSTGPHLHFEVRINGDSVDPRLHLPPR